MKGSDFIKKKKHLELKIIGVKKINQCSLLSRQGGF